MAIHLADIKKAYYYLQRNGLRDTWNAARERLEERREAYVFQPPSEEELQEQGRLARKRWEEGECATAFSILAPAYRTEPQYLREMIDSLRGQSYPYWELILADATEDDSVANVVLGYEGVEQVEDAGKEGGSASACGRFRAGRILYFHLADNGGIAENTNAALAHVRGNYVGLLDHDDVLVENALYEVAERIREEKARGTEIKLIYSDEDKCNSDRTRFFEPNKKEGFNLDLILSNNYICHFLVLRSSLIRKLRFRKAYEGAQDYDLILRAVNSLELLQKPWNEKEIAHISKALYHWRCHEASTAGNPHSKEYAYEAGREALQDFADHNGIDAKAVMLRHMGFYQLEYRSDLFASRRDIGAVGGVVLAGGKIAGGRMDRAGTVFYQGLPSAYSGYLHRAVLAQDAEAVDIRCIAVREELHGLFEEVTGVRYRTLPDGGGFDVSVLPEDSDYRELSLKLCRAICERGYRILWRNFTSALLGPERSEGGNE